VPDEGAGADRVLARLEELYELDPGVGANRPGLSAAEQAAHDLVASWMLEARLDADVDLAGNLVGRLRGTRPELPEVWTGSHLDTVPMGGRFDGALGVVAGLEAVERAGRRERTLTVVAFRDEEGHFAGCFGSGALCGYADLDAVDAAGTSVRDALAALGLPEPRAGALPGVFVEAHIEQGPTLERADAPLGLVTAIAAMTRGTVDFEGRAGHAGTTPMAARDDALCRAAEFVLHAQEAARSIPGAVATVGQLAVEPGAANVIPSRVRLSIDARAPDRATLDALIEALGVPVPGADEVRMAEEPARVLREEIERLGLPVIELASGAGHDAGVLAAAGVSTAMLFVRSLNGGVSHSPDEHSSAEDVALCVDVLAAALARLAG
jgi:hydantoinase/carbamoylase family amidase